MAKPIIAIVGRPNVGKSTFFNRKIQKREAIVDAVSGVTRDRHYGKSDWNGRVFTLIDTGGYVEHSDDIFQKEIGEQLYDAIVSIYHRRVDTKAMARVVRLATATSRTTSAEGCEQL